MPKLPQFEARHDWPAIKLKWLELTQQGLSGVEIARRLGVPRPTLALKAAAWRKDLNSNASPPHSPQRGGGDKGEQNTKEGSTDQTPRGEGQKGLTPETEASSILKNAMPDAARALVAQLTNADGTPSRDAQTTRAALQLLKDLQHTDDKDSASPYASMTEAQLEARALELWPRVAEARRLLGHSIEPAAAPLDTPLQ